MTRMGALVLAILIGLPAMPLQARAAEYRLLVANLHENSFTSFLKPGELDYGAAGQGLARMEVSLDRGEVSKGALLYDRHLQVAREGVARAYGGVHVSGAAVQQGGSESGLWDEVRWEGKPGERTVWVIAPSSSRPQELRRLALKGFGPIRQFQPFTLPRNGARLVALSLPLNLLWDQEDRGTAWKTYVSQGLDLSQGIAAVVGTNTNPFWADHVYLIVSQGEGPAIYKAVLGWRQHPQDNEAPGDRRIPN